LAIPEKNPKTASGGLTAATIKIEQEATEETEIMESTRVP
jgi:hypothetical protein